MFKLNILYGNCFELETKVKTNHHVYYFVILNWILDIESNMYIKDIQLSREPENVPFMSNCPLCTG